MAVKYRESEIERRKEKGKGSGVSERGSVLLLILNKCEHLTKIIRTVIFFLNDHYVKN